jgi:hypothetical protein
MAGTLAASRALARGTMARRIPRAAAPSSAGSTPRTARISPESESSPSIAVPSSAAAGALPTAAIAAAAIATSKPPPLLRRSAGARLTVITYSPRSIPICCSADRTRTRLSRTLASARPTR